VVQLAAALDIYESVLTQASLGKVHRHLRIIKDQMLSALEKAGLEVNIPVGKPFNEVANVVHVDGWRHHADFLSEVVAEVIEPIVTYRGRLVRMGRVVMGAPPDKVTEQIMTDKVEKT
jgi:molecular chaperone GrpE (heat shock protein)